MQTIKNAVVIVLLLFVLYGGYTALTGTDTPLKPELENQLLSLDNMPDVSSPGPFVSTGTSSAGNGFESFSSSPSSNFGASNTPSPFSTPSTGPAPIASSSTPNAPLLASTTVPSLGTPNLGTPSSLTPNNTTSNTTAPLLQPGSGASTESPSFPPLPANNDFPPLPDLSGGADEASTISTGTPSFGIGGPSSKVPADFTSSTTSSNDVAPSAFNRPSDYSDPSLDGSGGTSSGLIPSSASQSFQHAKELAMEQSARGNLKEALATMSVFYSSAEITTEQRQDMLDMLDALAREVIYSRRHLLDIAYTVAPGDSLDQISKQFQVPADIIAKINAIDPSAPLPSSKQLKVFNGPFRAEVDLAHSELTVFLGDLYAGRYPISVGSEPSPQPGVFSVQDKRKDRNYYGNGTQSIQATDPRNPYGGYWIDLGHELCIHGSPAAGSTSDSRMGCVSLSPVDAIDVFGMLSIGSQVTIRK